MKIDFCWGVQVKADLLDDGQNAPPEIATQPILAWKLWVWKPAV